MAHHASEPNVSNSSMDNNMHEHEPLVLISIKYRLFLYFKYHIERLDDYYVFIVFTYLYFTYTKTGKNVHFVDKKYILLYKKHLHPIPELVF